MALRLSCTHRHRRIYSGSTSVLGDTGCSKLPKVLAASDVDVALVAAAKRACVVHLPPYMRAGIWLSMNVIPKNAHGKLDRMKTKALISSACSDHYLKASSEQANGNGILLGAAQADSIKIFRSPSSETEIALVATLSDILRRPAPQIDLDESFLTLGGSSLQAMRLSSALQSQGFRVNVSDCLNDEKTIAMLAAVPRRSPQVANGTTPRNNQPSLLNGHVNLTVNSTTQYTPTSGYTRFSLAPSAWRTALRGPNLSPEWIEDVYPCTSIQELWVQLALDNNGQALLSQYHHELGADLDPVRFAWCWEQLRLREPALRTAFIQVEVDGTVLQAVLRPEATKSGQGLQMLEITSGEQVESTVANLHASHKLELGVVPSQAWLIHNNADGMWHLAISRHHSIHDAATLDLQGDDLNALYHQKENALPLIDNKRSLQSSFGAYLMSLVTSTTQREFWRRYLAGAKPAIWPSPSKVPTTFCKSLSEFSIHIAEWNGRLDEIQKVVPGVTKVSLVRGAFAVALAEMEGRQDTLVYETVEGRRGAFMEMWGFAMHIHVTRIDVPVDEDKSERDRYVSVARTAGRRFAETLEHVGLGWETSNEVLGSQVEPGCKFQTAILNILDMSSGALRKDKRVGGEGVKSSAGHLFEGSLVRSSIVGVFLPLCIEMHILADKILFVCPHDPVVVEKSDVERLVVKMMHVLDTLNA